MRRKKNRKKYTHIEYFLKMDLNSNPTFSPYSLAEHRENITLNFMCCHQSS